MLAPLSWLKEYNRLEPDPNAAFYTLIDTYNALGLYDEAFELSKKRTQMSEINAINPHYNRQIAMSKFFKKEYSEALNYAQVSTKCEYEHDKQYCDLNARSDCSQYCRCTQD